MDIGPAVSSRGVTRAIQRILQYVSSGVLVTATCWNQRLFPDTVIRDKNFVPIDHIASATSR
jgi:hypothetical protein